MGSEIAHERNGHFEMHKICEITGSSKDSVFRMEKSQSKSGTEQLADILATLEKKNQEYRARTPSATPTNPCSVCGDPLKGEFVTAGGKNFHPKCFTCAKCSALLGGKTFFNQEEKHWCEKCFNERFRETCVRCGKTCNTQFMSAMGKNWHKECFTCATCETPLFDITFNEKDGVPYCEKCYAKEFSPRCKKCGEPIIGEAIFQKQGKWHRDCFKCDTCGELIMAGGFFMTEDLLLCRECGSKSTNETSD